MKLNLPDLTRLKQRTGDSRKHSNPLARKSTRLLEILLPEGSDAMTVDWCLRAGGDIERQGENTPLAELAELKKGAKIVVWTPAKHTLLAPARIPTRNRSRIRQALPYTLEDILLGDPAEQHYTFVHTDAQNLAVTVTHVALLRSWLEILNSNGLYPSQMFPASLGIEVSDKQWVVAKIGNQVILKTSDDQGISLPDNWDLLVAVLNNQFLKEKDASQAPDNVLLINVGDDVQAESLAAALSITVTRKECSSWEILQLPGNELNLMQGDFAPAREANPMIARVAPAAAMLGIWLLGMIILNTWEWLHLKNQQRQISSEMVSIFRASFPEAKTVVDPALQMQRMIDDLAGTGSGYSKDDFIVLLSKSATTLTAGGEHKIENVRYGDDGLNLSIGLRDFQSLEALKGRLQAGGLQVEVVAANSRSDGVEGRLRIKSGS